MILDIISIGDPVLRMKAKKIQVFDRDLRNLAENMLETLRNSGGVGLAAPQIGDSIRMIVVEYADTEKDENAKPQTFTLVNPEITGHSAETETGVEGCLSVPGLVGEVERWQSVKIKAQNLAGKPVKVSAEGWLARIFQHEIDHLDGICYVDRTDNVWKPEDKPEGEDDEGAESGEENSARGGSDPEGQAPNPESGI